MLCLLQQDMIRHLRYVTMDAVFCRGRIASRRRAMPCFGDDGDIDEEVGRLPGEQKYAKVSLHGQAGHISDNQDCLAGMYGNHQMHCMRNDDLNDAALVHR